MNIVFAGTPAFAATCLQRLLNNPDIHVVGVITQPDRKAGRGMKLMPSAVKRIALAEQLDCITPQTLKDNDDALAWLQHKKADFLVVVAYGMILPPAWLSAVTIAPVNVHASLLPRWRGAAPIERAILAGDDHTGVCIMRMEEGLDTGPVYCTATIPIDADTIGIDLWLQLADVGARLLSSALKDIMHQEMCAMQQSLQGISYAKKITTDDRHLDWQQSAQCIDRMVRCFTPKPGARCRFQARWLKIIAGTISPMSDHHASVGTIVGLKDGIDIICGDGTCYRISQLQLEGKAAMAAADFARGQRLRLGDSLPLRSDC